MKKDTAILVLSCDKYSDLWPIFFHFFFKNWPDCPLKIYLLSNHDEYSDTRVTTLKIGEDKSWSENLINAVNLLPESKVLFFLEDAFLVERVDSEKIMKLIEWSSSKKVEYLRLRPDPKPDLKYNNEIGLISKQAMWRTSLFISIWDKKVLLDLLIPGENAWQFEIDGTIRSYKYENFFSVKKPVIQYLHGVEKGKWILSTYNKVKAKRIVIDIKNNKREVMSKMEYREYILSGFKGRLILLIPMKYRWIIILRKRKISDLSSQMYRTLFR
jgi:hypothetical protein